MTIKEAKKQMRMAEWVGHIQERQESGLSVQAWCAIHGYGEGRYYYWLKIVRSEALKQAGASVAGSLVKVEPEGLPTTHLTELADETSERTGITLQYERAIVEFPRGTAIEEIAELLKALCAP